MLGLSYDELPYHLKLCFLYIAHFPEDVEIRVKELTRTWMAEGLILLSKHRVLVEIMKDVTYECLCELVQRCIVQGDLDLIRRIKTCRIHDLMIDMSLSKA